MNIKYDRQSAYPKVKSLDMKALYYTPGPRDKDTPSLVGHKDGKTRVIAIARTPAGIFRQLFSVHGPALRGNDSSAFWARIEVGR